VKVTQEGFIIESSVVGSPLPQQHEEPQDEPPTYVNVHQEKFMNIEPNG